MDRNYIIAEGKTLQAAIDNGLKALNTQIDYVNVDVLEEGKSVLNIIIKNYKVKITEKAIKYEDDKNIKNNENGKFEIKDDCLSIYPPKGLGAPVSYQEIALKFENIGVYDIDINKIKFSLTSNEIVSINIQDLKVSNPIDAKAEIEISKDEMKAYITILPPKGGEMITKEEIYTLFKDNNIVYGLDDHTIDIMISQKQFNLKQLIAVGKEPINGEDGKINFIFDIDIKVKPQINEDGKVDYKELNMIQCVNKGDCIAQKILPTDGIDGITIKGKVIKAKPGKLVHFKKGKNVIEIDDGLKLIAEVDGQPRLEHDKVTVLQVYEVNGNVDHSTGNIDFIGKVIVRGNVSTGFKIECTEDVEVYGVVEGATIITEGNIILHKGIHGQNAGKLISKKDIVSKYMESCYAKADGNINAEVIMHCNLQSKGSISITGKKGMLVGGKIRANNEVSARSIGSPMATVTKIEVGLDPEIKERYESLKQELEVLYKNKENVIKAIELLSKMAKITELSKEKQDILNKSINTEKYLNEKIIRINESIMDLKNILQDLSNGRINASFIIYPGVKITIGNSVYYVRDDIHSATVVRENGEIKIIPYIGK